MLKLWSLLITVSFTVTEDETSECGASNVDLPVKKFKNEADDSGSSDVVDPDQYITHRNQPMLMTTYSEPETGQEKLFLLISVPEGARNLEFSIVGNGPGSMKAQVTYSWPSLTYDLDSIFERAFKTGLPTCHPKIMALKKELENHRDCVDEIPVGVIELSLPIPVQTAAESIKFQGGLKDGHRIVMADLKAYAKPYLLKQADKIIKFDEL